MPESSKAELGVEISERLLEHVVLVWSVDVPFPLILSVSSWIPSFVISDTCHTPASLHLYLIVSTPVMCLNLSVFSAGHLSFSDVSIQALFLCLISRVFDYFLPVNLSSVFKPILYICHCSLTSCVPTILLIKTLYGSQSLWSCAFASSNLSMIEHKISSFSAQTKNKKIILDSSWIQTFLQLVIIKVNEVKWAGWHMFLNKSVREKLGRNQKPTTLKNQIADRPLCPGLQHPPRCYHGFGATLRQ